MTIADFTEIPATPGFAMDHGDKLILIQRVGVGPYASWGFTIWTTGPTCECIAGESNWDWTVEDTLIRINAALGRLT
jgi:hypothetical protein